MLVGPKPFPLLGPKPLLLMTPNLSSLWASSLSSQRQFTLEAILLDHLSVTKRGTGTFSGYSTPPPPQHTHTQTYPSTGNNTDHHNSSNPTNCNQHLYIIIVIPQRISKVHAVLILLHCMPCVNL